MTDNVNHPSHYIQGEGKHECIEVLKEWMSEDEFKGFLKGNAIKYLCRAGKKIDKVEDLKKSQFYINRLILEETK